MFYPTQGTAQGAVPAPGWPSGGILACAVLQNGHLGGGHTVSVCEAGVATSANIDVVFQPLA